MNRIIYFVFLFIISVSLYIIEQNTMFGTDIVGAKNTYTTIFIIAMLFASITSLFLSNNYLIRDTLSKRITMLMVVIYLISLAYAVAYPFAARNTYGMIILPLFTFYFTANCTQYVKNDNRIIWAMTIVAILLSVYFLMNYHNNLNYNKDAQSNASYAILYLLPFMLCHKKKLFQILFIVLVLIVVMYSMKRGGFLALLGAVGVYLFISQISLKKRKFNLFSIFLLSIVSIVLYYGIVYINDVILGGNLFNRFEDISDGSGRLSIYAYYWNMFTESDVVSLLFGRGWGGSIRNATIGVTCHNDLLEVLINFGIIGFVCYISFIISLVKLCLKMIKNKHIYAPAMGASLAMFFINSMVSHIIIYPWYLMEYFLFWGFMSYSVNNNCIINKYHRR